MKQFKRIKKWVAFGLITGACSLGAVSLYAMKPEQKADKKTPPPIKRVSVQEASPGTYPARVTAYGEVNAKWTTTVRAQVAGRIIRINDTLLPGRRLKAGELIIELDPTNYLAVLAQARLECENARVNLIQVERRASQAVSDWKGSGIKQAPVSPLVFHAPQLKAARARVTYTQKTVDKAKNDLNQTRILAPYDGVVGERFADKGETLFAGDQVVTLISTNDVEIRVNLDGAQVNTMGDWQDTRVDILDPATGRAWTGKLVRDAGMVDPKNRLRKFYLKPKTPDPELLPGMFVTAVINGAFRHNLLALPESCLTREGDIWFVDKEDRLRRLPAKVAFYEKGKVYIENIGGMASLKVVTAPAAGFIAGTKVFPVQQGEG